MKLVWERMKIVIEPSSAVALAVVINIKAAFWGKN
jgi:threonine dehydratase